MESVIPALHGAGCGLPKSIKKLSAAGEALALSFENGPTLYIDCYLGTILGERSKCSVETARPFFRDVRSLHRWLMTSGASRVIGKGITGASNPGLLFLIVGGRFRPVVDAHEFPLGAGDVRQWQRYKQDES